MAFPKEYDDGHGGRIGHAEARKLAGEMDDYMYPHGEDSFEKLHQSGHVDHETVRNIVDTRQAHADGFDLGDYGSSKTEYDQTQKKLMRLFHYTKGRVEAGHTGSISEAKMETPFQKSMRRGDADARAKKANRAADSKRKGEWAASWANAKKPGPESEQERAARRDAKTEAASELIRAHLSEAKQRSDRAANHSLVKKLAAAGDLRNAMTHAIVGADRRGEYGPNIHAMPLMLGAAQRARDHMDNGNSLEDALSTHFTPTRSNHTMAKLLGAKLGVERGQWVKKS